MIENVIVVEIISTEYSNQPFPNQAHFCRAVQNSCAPGALRLRYPAEMDIGNMLAELRQEHAQLTEAILSLERVAFGQGKRRGRQPKWLAAANQDVTLPKRRGRPPGSKNAPKTE